MSTAPIRATPRRSFRWLKTTAAAALVLLLSAGVTGYIALRSSLPRLDGSVPVSGLSSPVTVLRDSLGIPTVHAATQADAMRAIGYLHAQDRFFQMDLMRRRAAGELSELLGKGALPLDKAVCIHRFRALASQVIAREAPAQRALLAAYTAGVNAGLSDLSARPFEYFVLRAAPRPWSEEDTLLVAYALVLDLEDSTGRYKRTLSALCSSYGFVGLDFFAPLQTPRDAALDGSTATLPAVPKPSVIDLHTRTDSADLARARPGAYAGVPDHDWVDLGSNSLAVDAAHAGGAALVANDVHLNLGVPNTWYRAAIEWPGHRAIGLTLPGVPYILAGSNGKIAWGWTVAYASMGDLISIPTELSADMYHGPGKAELLTLERHKDTIQVRGGDPVEVESRWTLWGPIVSDDGHGRLTAYQWIFDRPEGLNLGIGRIEFAGSAAEAVALAHRSGMPALSLMVADASGRIGWTVSGAIPRRVGYNGRTPVTYAYSDRRWDGTLPADSVPKLLNPRDGILWSGNGRMVGGQGLDLLGDGGYARPARAAQLRDDLRALVARGQPVTAADLLQIQLDNRALALEPWRALLLGTLPAEPDPAKPDRATLREVVLRAWDGRASVDSVSYTFVRNFRLAVARRVLEPIYARPREFEPDLDWTHVNYEEPLLKILAERPLHLLDAQYGSWEDLLLQAADDVTTDLRRQGIDPGKATWGGQNTALIVHPFYRILPHALVGWLRMPADPLAGDSDMPRVLGPSRGASVRFAVSPGHEEAGIMEMPGGESAHPLSPYFKAGHEAWVRGEPAPFLPGAPEHTLTLAAAR